MESASLFELNEYIRRVFALNFPEPIWINCEISQIKDVRGNYYLDLVEQNEKEEIIAQASAVIWYKSFLFIKNKLGPLTNSLLQAGIEVRVKVNVDFNERYGYKLVIEDIDPAFTMGKLELSRQKIIERLKNEGVWELNHEVSFPRVIQRIALISSEKAAGYADFVSQLQNNPYGYKFELSLFQSSMQGQNTERDVSQALDTIGGQAHLYDAVFIIRGGGSKLDLSFFDNFNIGYKISTCKLPVITGIGHEIDESVADMTAYMALKTPTACAAMVIETAMNFESEILGMEEQIVQLAKSTLDNAKFNLESATQLLVSLPLEKIRSQQNLLQNLSELFNTYAGFRIKSAHQFLEHAESVIHFSDPIQVLKKGYALVRQEGKLTSSKTDFKPSKPTSITFHDGTIEIK